MQFFHKNVAVKATISFFRYAILTAQNILSKKGSDKAMLKGAFMYLFVLCGKFFSALFKLLSFKFRKDVLQGTVTDEKQWDSYTKKGKVNGKHFEYAVSSRNKKGKTTVYTFRSRARRTSKPLYSLGDTVCFRRTDAASPEDEPLIETREGLREEVKRTGLSLLIAFGAVLLVLCLAAAVSVWSEP